MVTPNKYEIDSLTDFLNVPPEKRAACLSEFLLALEIFDRIKHISRDAFHFIWTDDAKHDITVAARTIDAESDDELTLTWKGKSKAKKS